MARDLPTNTLTELADGVLVWLQPGGESGVSNAGVVVDDDGLTVIDTLMVPEQWQPFAAAVNGLGLQFGSITAGVGFSLLSHVGFGLVGGIAGALAGSALRQRVQQR